MNRMNLNARHSTVCRGGARREDGEGHPAMLVLSGSTRKLRVIQPVGIPTAQVHGTPYYIVDYQVQPCTLYCISGISTVPLRKHPEIPGASASINGAQSSTTTAAVLRYSTLCDYPGGYCISGSSQRPSHPVTEDLYGSACTEPGQQYTATRTSLRGGAPGRKGCGENGAEGVRGRAWPQGARDFVHGALYGCRR